MARTVTIASRGAAGGTTLTVEEVAPGIGVAVGMDAHTLANHLGVYHQRTRGCTPVPQEEMEKLNAAALHVSPGGEYVAYVRRVLEILKDEKTSDAMESDGGEGHRPEAADLMASFSGSPLPASWRESPGYARFGPDQVIPDASGTGDSGLRVILASGLHGWDWWTAAGDAQRRQDGTGTWSIVSVPFRQSFTEGDSVMHPAVLLAHQLAHAHQMHSGRYDRRVADVIQTNEMHHYGKREMSLSEVEARGKRVQLRHVTLGAEGAVSREKPKPKPHLLELTRGSLAAAEEYLHVLEAKGLDTELAHSVLRSRRAVVDGSAGHVYSERSAGKELRTFYQSPPGQIVQKIWEMYIWDLDKLLPVLTKQAGIRNAGDDNTSTERLVDWAKVATGYDDKEKKEDPAERVQKANPIYEYVQRRPTGGDLFDLADKNIATSARNYKNWEEPYAAGTQARANIDRENAAAGMTSKIVGYCTAGLAATITGLFKTGYDLTRSPQYLNYLPQVKRHAAAILAWQGRGKELGLPEFREPADEVREQGADSPSATAQTVEEILVPAPGGLRPVRVVRLPKFPAVAVAVDEDARTLAAGAGVTGSLTRHATPLPEEEADRMASLASGPAVVPHDFIAYVTELLELQSDEGHDLLTEVNRTTPLPAKAVRDIRTALFENRKISLTKEDFRLESRQTLKDATTNADSGVKVLVGVGHHGWDWWAAPGNGPRGGEDYGANAAGTWSLLSIPYKKSFSEGYYPVTPDVMTAHLLAYVHQIHTGRHTQRQGVYPVELSRTTQDHEYEVLARGTHPYIPSMRRHVAELRKWASTWRGGVQRDDSTIYKNGDPGKFHRTPESIDDAYTFAGFVREKGRNLGVCVEGYERAAHPFLFSERQHAASTHGYAQRSYREKEQILREFDLKTSPGELKSAVQKMRSNPLVPERPDDAFRLANALPDNTVDLKMAGKIKIGAAMLVRKDVLPAASKMELMYERYGQPMIGKAAGMVTKTYLENVAEDIPVIDVLAAAIKTKNINKISNVAQKEWSYGRVMNPECEQMPQYPGLGEMMYGKPHSSVDPISFFVAVQQANKTPKKYSPDSWQRDVDGLVSPLPRLSTDPLPVFPVFPVFPPAGEPVPSPAARGAANGTPAEQLGATAAAPKKAQRKAAALTA
ncbi:hypothetical protein ABT071_36615 [Streptomyces sp. NPDC002506]|uniref:hypothetical protein n=1 Tax=Streptomyces sp. NPDC002506 TaxID=3154536 RepID=UPI0033181ACB